MAIVHGCMVSQCRVCVCWHQLHHSDGSMVDEAASQSNPPAAATTSYLQLIACVAAWLTLESVRTCPTVMPPYRHTEMQGSLPPIQPACQAHSATETTAQTRPQSMAFSTYWLGRLAVSLPRLSSRAGLRLSSQQTTTHRPCPLPIWDSYFVIKAHGL